MVSNPTIAPIKATGAPSGNTISISTVRTALNSNAIEVLMPVSGAGKAYVAVSCDAIMGMLFKGRLPRLLPAIQTAVTEGGYTVFVQNAWWP